MSENSINVLRGEKVAGIIEALSELYAVSLEVAADMYYSSETSDLIEEGVADLQCRSDKYLASVVWDEFQEMSGRNRIE